MERQLRRQEIPRLHRHQLPHLHRRAAHLRQLLGQPLRIRGRQQQVRHLRAAARQQFARAPGGQRPGHARRHAAQPRHARQAAIGDGQAACGTGGVGEL